MQFRGSCCSSAVRPLLDLVQSDLLGPAWWLHAVAARCPVTKVAGTNTYMHRGVDLILLWLRDPDGTKVAVEFLHFSLISVSRDLHLPALLRSLNIAFFSSFSSF